MVDVRRHSKRQLASWGAGCAGWRGTPAQDKTRVTGGGQPARLAERGNNPRRVQSSAAHAPTPMTARPALPANARLRPRRRALLVLAAVAPLLLLASQLRLLPQHQGVLLKLASRKVDAAGAWQASWQRLAGDCSGVRRWPADSARGVASAQGGSAAACRPRLVSMRAITEASTLAAMFLHLPPSGPCAKSICKTGRVRPASTGCQSQHCGFSRQPLVALRQTGPAR